MSLVVIGMLNMWTTILTPDILDITDIQYQDGCGINCLQRVYLTLSYQVTLGLFVIQAVE